MTGFSEVQSAYKKARLSFKIAQEDMTISNEDKILQREKMDILADNTVDALSAPRNANDNLDFTSPDEEVLERTNIGQEDDDKEKDAITNDDKEKDAITNDDKEKDAINDDKKEMKKELDAMKVQMAQMIDDKKRTKIAQNYGKLFPEQMREARVKSFLANKEPIRILSARFDEAATLLTNKTALKVAQIENKTGVFNFADLDSNSSNGLEYGGKI